MYKALFASVASLSLLAIAPAYSGQSVDVAKAETGVTQEQAGRIVLQGGQAIGTLTEISEADNLAVIALMDGSEKEVSLGDLVITEDGSIELVAMVDTDDSGSTYE